MSIGILPLKASVRLGWLPALLPLLAALLLYRGTLAEMVATWARSGTFMHAFLVPPIAAWLVWRRREALAALAPRPSPWMLLPMAAVAGVWLLGELAAVNAATQAALVALLVLAVPAVLGLAAARLLLFPLGFLFFAVPIGDFMVPTLMAWTADFTVAALRLTGIPVYREGQQFVIPSGAWSVVEACSGIRYLMASLMTGVLFAHLSYRSLHRRLIFAGVSIAVPLLANWLRAYLIVLLGHLSSNELAAGADHLIYGWIFFGVVILLMFMIGMRWSESEAAASPAPSDPSPAAAASAQPGRRRSAWPVAALAAALLVLPHGLLWRIERSERADRPPQLAGLVTPTAGWRAGTTLPTDWKPAFRHASAELNLGHARRDGSVALYVGYYHRQGGEAQLVGSGNRLVSPDDARWTQVAAGPRHLQLAGREFAVQATRLRGSPLPGQERAPRLAVWQLYWVNGTLTASEIRATLALAWHRLLGRGSDAAVIVVSTPQRADGTEEAVLAAFLRDHLPGLEAGLRRVREARHLPPPAGTSL